MTKNNGEVVTINGVKCEPMECDDIVVPPISKPGQIGHFDASNGYRVVFRVERVEKKPEANNNENS